jgi:hypothetical protein
MPSKSNTHYIFRVCVCSFSYTALKAHAPYYTVICGLSGSTINGSTINGKIPPPKKVTEHKMYYDFRYKFRLEYFSF